MMQVVAAVSGAPAPAPAAAAPAKAAAPAAAPPAAPAAAPTPPPVAPPPPPAVAAAAATAAATAEQPAADAAAPAALPQKPTAPKLRVGDKVLLVDKNVTGCVRALFFFSYLTRPFNAPPLPPPRFFRSSSQRAAIQGPGVGHGQRHVVWH
jgi:hypothetical protein